MSDARTRWQREYSPRSSMSDAYAQRMCGTQWTWESLQISEKRREVRLSRWNAASWEERADLEGADAFAGWEFAPGEWVWPDKRTDGCKCGGCYYRFSTKWWAFCGDERDAKAADKRRELESERQRLSSQIRIARVSDLRVGWRINGRVIENITSTTAFGFVRVDWGFGADDSSEFVVNAEPPEEDERHASGGNQV